MSERSRAVLLTVVAFILVGSLLALVHSYQRFGSGSTRTSIAIQSSTSPGYTWLRGADLPTPRAETAAVLVGNEAYVLGGFDANGAASAKVEVYNTTSDIWRTASPLPVALHHAGAAVVNGRIYIVGGYLEGWIPTGAVWVYNPKADTWSSGTGMPTKSAALAVQAINGRLFAIGGSGEASVLSP